MSFPASPHAGAPAPLGSPTVPLVAIVPAAGVGARAVAAGTSPNGLRVAKQYQELAGTAMLCHTVRALLTEARIDRVLVLVAPQDDRAEVLLRGWPRVECHRCGGAERAETVANGLALLDLDEQAWVLVHDAARPGLPQRDLQRLIDACLPDPVGGLLARPADDTVKRARAELPDPVVADTLPRQTLWLAQTPQMFRLGHLRRALAQAREQGMVPTDEASAIEAAGWHPRLVPGSRCNFKVTWPEDFVLMERWLT